MNQVIKTRDGNSIIVRDMFNDTIILETGEIYERHTFFDNYFNGERRHSERLLRGEDLTLPHKVVLETGEIYERHDFFDNYFNGEKRYFKRLLDSVKDD